MSSDPRWLKLRADSSVWDSFEGLCCQLAAAESPGGNAEFVRVKAPDAGVECYWRFPDGTEHAWQAKFFLNRLGPAQWRQIDKSVCTAIAKRPKLRQYTVCLPRDLEEPRLQEKSSARDSWDQHVSKWRRCASARRMRIEFRLWGSSELWDRLAQERHIGRRQYWFGSTCLSEAWQRKRLREAIGVAGERYTPECNVRLPVARVFDGLGRTPAFLRRLAERLGALHGPSRRALPVLRGEPKFAEFVGAVEGAFELAELGGGIETVDVGQALRTAEIRAAASDLADPVGQAWLTVSALAREVRCVETPPPTDWSSLAHYLGKLRRAVDDLRDFLGSDEVLASERRFLILVGAAGIGKTHLLCDVAELRLAAQAPTVLILGEQIAETSWNCAIVDLLGLERDVTFDSFLGALDACAEACGKRALLLIDALNETMPRKTWKSAVPVLLERVRSHPRVALAVSVRSTYEGVTLPVLPDADAARFEHYGFAGSEDEAVPIVFRAHGLHEPSAPLLQPEFSNPLFLKLMCKWLRESGRDQLPRGHTGLLDMFRAHIAHVEARLSAENELDDDRKACSVERALRAFSEQLVKAGRGWVERLAAAAAIDAVLPGRTYSRSLFAGLLREGVLSEDRFRVAGGGAVDGVRFTYERFGDHVIASALANDVVIDDETGRVEIGPALEGILRAPDRVFTHAGVFEALALVLPEERGVELFDVARGRTPEFAVRRALVASLPWRSPGSCTERLWTYVCSELLTDAENGDSALDALVMLGCYANHPLNARRLDAVLSALTMFRRDAWWSVYLHGAGDGRHPVSRLLRWADSPASQAADEGTAELAGILLGWCLTTSDRGVRDRATKALVRVFEDRPAALARLVARALAKNDPYLIERVAAAAYGCVLRSRRPADWTGTAAVLFERVVARPDRPYDLLLWDYAQGISDVMRRASCPGPWDHAVAPVEGAELTDPPSKSELRGQLSWTPERGSDADGAMLSILNSVFDHGDFGRYCVEPAVRHWLSRPLAWNAEGSDEERVRNFTRRLTPRQRRFLGAFRRALDGEDAARMARMLGRDEPKPDPWEAARANTASALDRLRRSLRGESRRRLDADIVPLLSRGRFVLPNFSAEVARRWIVHRIQTAGWDGEAIGPIDMALRGGYHDRGRRKCERFGKKYQWIALHELLARLAAGYTFVGDSARDEPRPFPGAWTTSSRDIDPSHLDEPLRDPDAASGDRPWWAPHSVASWDEPAADRDWTSSRADLPDPAGLIRVAGADDVVWYALESHTNWRQPSPPGRQDLMEFPERDVWCQIRSYFVERADARRFVAWARRQDFMVQRMPEAPQGGSDLFLGEFFESAAFEDVNVPYHSRGGWVDPERGRLPCRVHVTTDTYDWERGHDGATVRYRLPTALLARKLGLRWSGRRGDFVAPDGHLVAQDPSGAAEVCLVRATDLAAFLDAARLEIVWTVLGEKRVLGGGWERNDFPSLTRSGAYRRDGAGLIGGCKWSVDR